MTGFGIRRETSLRLIIAALSACSACPRHVSRQQKYDWQSPCLSAVRASRRLRGRRFPRSADLFLSLG